MCTAPERVCDPFLPSALRGSARRPLPPPISSHPAISPRSRRDLALPRQARKPFQFLMVGVLREYLALEFRIPRMPFPFDPERVGVGWGLGVGRVHWAGVEGEVVCACVRRACECVSMRARTTHVCMCVCAQRTCPLALVTRTLFPSQHLNPKPQSNTNPKP